MVKIFDILGEIVAGIALVMLYVASGIKEINSTISQILYIVAGMMAICGILFLLILHCYEYNDIKNNQEMTNADWAAQIFTDILGVAVLSIVLVFTYVVAS